MMSLPIPVHAVFAAAVSVAFVAPERSAERLVDGLELRKVPGFRLTDHVAIAAEATDERIVDGILGRLRIIGVRRAFAVPPSDAADQARDRGARWLLRLQRTDGHLQLTLRQVDDGLWTSPSAGVLASAQVEVERVTFPVGPDGSGPPSKSVELGPNPQPGLYGPPKAMIQLPGAPLALACCPNADADALLVLTRSHLFRVDFGDRWKVTAQASLDGLDRHPTPSRFPVGVLQCDASGAAFATSDLAQGYELNPRTLAIGASLDGAPLTRSDGRWLLGALHQGLPVWKHSSGTLTWGHPGGNGALILTPDGVLRQGDMKLAKTGIGATAMTLGGTTYWVRTGTGPWQGPDEVQLGRKNRPLGRAISLPSPVRATALGQLPSGAWVLAVALPNQGQTAIQALRVVLP